jgi:hypothetical protein
VRDGFAGADPVIGLAFCLPFESIQMKQPFNHAANDSPRSGSSKWVTPIVWGVIVVALVAIATWFAIMP